VNERLRNGVGGSLNGGRRSGRAAHSPSLKLLVFYKGTRMRVKLNGGAAARLRMAATAWIRRPKRARSALQRR